MIIILNNEDLNNTTTEKIVTPADYLNIRCPQCLKSFMVLENQIKSIYPEFTCTGCKCHFTFEYPVPNREAIITFQVAPTQFEFKKKCPKCEFMQNEHNEVCSACGIVMENFVLLRNETYPRVSVNLIKLWNDVLQEFENGLCHELFIRTCQAQQKLDYAEFKYKELGKRAGDESMVTPWLERINPQKYDPNYRAQTGENLTEKSILPTDNRGGVPTPILKAMEIYDYMSKNYFFYYAGGGAGVLFILAGATMHGKRNQIGLGIAVFLCTLVLYTLNNKPTRK